MEPKIRPTWSVRARTSDRALARAERADPRRSDTVAFKDGFVTIATMAGDMSARRFQQNRVARRIGDLAQH
jgi:hypothetical protein